MNLSKLVRNKTFKVKKSSPYEKYKEQRELGKGGYANVFLHRKGRDYIAIKKFNKTNIDSKSEFNLEIAGYQGAGQHKNLVKFLDAYENESYFCIVLEYCAEGELKGIFKKFQYTEREVRDIVVQCSEALLHLLKRKVVHRDIKPANILVKKWYPIHVCLADLNFSRKVKSAEHSTVMGTNLGTKGYKAPEITDKGLRNDKRKYNFTVDVYALGVVAYELLTGEYRNRPNYALPNAMVNEALSNFPGNNREKAAHVNKLKITYLEELAAKGVTLSPPEQWEKISDEAKEVVAKMISPIYTYRPDYETILASAWAQINYPQNLPSIVS